MKLPGTAAYALLILAAACHGGSSSGATPDTKVVIGPATLAQQVVLLERGFTNPVFGRVVAVGDVDGNGTPDVFFGGGIHRNGGDGSFEEIAASVPAGGGVRAAVFGDLDGDAHVDLAVVAEQQLRVWRNDGDGRFTEAPAGTVPTIGTGVTDVANGDVDGDGDLDLLVGKETGQDRLLVNNGLGGFTDATAARMPASIGSRRVLLADFDSDGDLDALCGSASRYLRNDGGTFVLSPGSNPPQFFATDVAVGDVDGNGFPDLVVTRAAPFAPTVFLLLNNGNAQFVDQSNRLPVVNGYDDVAAAVAVGDVDGDGDLDIVAGDTIRLLLNNGLAFFTEAPPGQVAQCCGVTGIGLVDFDGDSDLDALFTTQASFDCELTRALNWLQVNDGHGRFRRWDRSIGAREVGVSGDFDGDLDLDFIQNPSWLYLNDGTGAATGVTVATRFTPPAIGAPLAAADFDHDGLDDLLCSAGLWRADGGGYFHAVPMPPMEWAVAAAVADFDRDGNVDCILARSQPGIGVMPLLLLRGDGTGAFVDVSATHLDGASLDGLAVAAADIDGDGDTDFAVTARTETGRSVFVYRNDGTGSFAAAAQPALTVGPAWLTELRLPDIDGDGDLDILLSGWSTDSVWENRGDAGFANRSAAVPFAGSASVGATILAAGDLDDDGDVDLLTQQGDGWRVYVQDAPFVFRHDAASQIPHWSMYPLVWSYLPYDMDGDGDLEWSGRTNLARHLHAASLATVGRPYVLQLFAHPGWLATARTATVFLGVDPAPQPLATPAGAFRVGAGAIALPPIVIPAPQGKTTLRVDVPAIPALVGLQLRAQALLGDAGDGTGRFTNFVVDTIGN